MLSLGRCLPYQQITQSQHSLSKLMSIEVLFGLHDAASQIDTAIEESFIRSHQTQGRCYADFASMRLSRGSRVPHHRSTSSAEDCSSPSWLSRRSWMTSNRSTESTHTERTRCCGEN